MVSQHRILKPAFDYRAYVADHHAAICPLLEQAIAEGKWLYNNGRYGDDPGDRESWIDPRKLLHTLSIKPTYPVDPIDAYSLRDPQEYLREAQVDVQRAQCRLRRAEDRLREAGLLHSPP